MNVEVSKISPPVSTEGSDSSLASGSKSKSSEHQRNGVPNSSIITLASQRHLKIKMLLPNSFTSKSKTRSEFIEVHWSSESEKLVKEQRIFRLYLDIDLHAPTTSTDGGDSTQNTVMRVPVNVVECGGGAFFCAANIPPGKYKINGTPFTVHPAQRKVGRKQKESKSKNAQSTSKNSSKSKTSTSTLNNSTPRQPTDSSNLSPVSAGIPNDTIKRRRIVGTKTTISTPLVNNLHSQNPVVETASSIGFSPLTGPLNQTPSEPPRLLFGDVQAHDNNDAGSLEGPPSWNIYADTQHKKGEEARTSPEFPDECLATPSECEDIKALRKLLGTALTEGRHAQYPEVVGDISLLRFLRGNKGNIEAAAGLFHDHLETRRKFKMDDCRDRCVTQMFSPGGIKFHQEQMIYGSLVREFLPMEYNCGMTIRGDPVCAVYYTGGRLSRVLREHGREKVLEFTVETFVRRQIQLDILSRYQGRLVRLVCFMQCLGGLWRLLAPGPARDFSLRT